MLDFWVLAVLLFARHKRAHLRFLGCSTTPRNPQLTVNVASNYTHASQPTCAAGQDDIMERTGGSDSYLIYMLRRCSLQLIGLGPTVRVRVCGVLPKAAWNAAVLNPKHDIKTPPTPYTTCGSASNWAAVQELE